MTHFSFDDPDSDASESDENTKLDGIFGDAGQFANSGVGLLSSRDTLGIGLSAILIKFFYKVL